MGVRALLVSPEIPPTYWSMRYALPFLGRKAAFPPLGLLTVAAMLPPDWDLNLVDLNVEPLTRQAVESADVILTSAMLVQRPSLERLIAYCRRFRKPIVAGGPYPTRCHEAIQGVDHFVLGEAEANLPSFLRDFAHGTALACYDDAAHPDLGATPPPRYDLAKRNLYAGAALQYSRGCPHACEFCDIVELFGHTPRTKSVPQFMREVDQLYEGGWRGSLFIVDDNFIGNRRGVRDLLPELARWQAQRGFPFSLFTEASLDLAADEDLMNAMVEAGFNMVFVGLETPDQGTLAAVHKRQNCHADLLGSVRAIQARGMEVSGGFILGFDQDREDIFERQIRFIQAAAIPTAMVGLLTALPGTRLAERLSAEGRLLETSSGGNNTHDLALNFVPRMEASRLRQGYMQVLEAIYTPRPYFRRCLQLIGRMKETRATGRQIRFMEVRAFVHSLVRQSFSRYAAAYWSYLAKALVTRPRMVSEIIAMAIKGHHFFTITEHLRILERFKARLDRLQQDLDAWLSSRPQDGQPRVARMLRQAQAWCHRVPPELRAHAEGDLDAFRISLERRLKASTLSGNEP